MRSFKYLLLILPLLAIGVVLVAGEPSLDEIRAMATGSSAEPAADRSERRPEPPSGELESLFARGVDLAESGQIEAARELFDQVRRQHPEMPEPYINLAVLYAAEADYQGAIDMLRAALGTHPAYRTAYENLIKIYGRLASDAYSQALAVGMPASLEGLELALVEEAGPAYRPTAAASPRADRPSQLAQAGPQPAAPAIEPAAPATEPVETAPAGPREPATVAPSSAPRDTSEDPGPSSGAIARAVQNWASAWSDQRVDDYLAAYSREYQPPNGQSREAWEASRRERIQRPEYINVSIAFLEASMETPDRGTVRFLQRYESNTFADRVTKSLRLVHEDGRWKILHEVVED